MVTLVAGFRDSEIQIEGIIYQRKQPEISFADDVAIVIRSKN